MKIELSVEEIQISLGVIESAHQRGYTVYPIRELTSFNLLEINFFLFLKGTYITPQADKHVLSEGGGLICEGDRIFAKNRSTPRPKGDRLRLLS